MFHKLAILSYFALTATCMVLHQQPIPVLLELQYNDDPNYTFTYDVNDPQTGDVKNQQESRRGDIVLGQYSLVQPDGITRTVEYRADDHSGFQATVNNELKAVETTTTTEAAKPIEPTEEPIRQPNIEVHIIHPWPTPSYSTTSPAPLAISRSSIQQTFSTVHNPWV